MKTIEMAENLGLDIEDINELIELYTVSTTSDLAELTTAIENGDTEKAHEKAHSIKGSSGNLGFDELYKLAKEIDDRARTKSLEGLDNLVHILHEKYTTLVKEL